MRKSIVAVWIVFLMMATMVYVEAAPIADAGGPYEISVGNDLFLDGSQSYETDQTKQLKDYKWDLPADGSPDEFGPQPVKPWEFLDVLGLSEAGTYPISLSVTNDIGQVDGMKPPLSSRFRHTSPSPPPHGFSFLVSVSRSAPVDIFHGADASTLPQKRFKDFFPG